MGANFGFPPFDDNHNSTTDIKWVGTEQSIVEAVERSLYLKAKAALEVVRLQEAAAILAEADPKPRVEKDHEGKPVVPSKEQYVDYFQGMATNFIHDQLNTAKDRWQAAGSEPAKAALKNELAAANEVLGEAAKKKAKKYKAFNLAAPVKKKQPKPVGFFAPPPVSKKKPGKPIGFFASNLPKHKKKKKKKSSTSVNGISKTGNVIRSAVNAGSGGSQFANDIAYHVTKRLFKAK